MSLAPDTAQQFHDEPLPKDSAKVAQLCSMKITQEVREFAKTQGVNDDKALDAGMESMSEEFKKAGGEIDIPISKA